MRHLRHWFIEWLRKMFQKNWFVALIAVLLGITPMLCLWFERGGPWWRLEPKLTKAIGGLLVLTQWLLRRAGSCPGFDDPLVRGGFGAFIFIGILVIAWLAFTAVFAVLAISHTQDNIAARRAAVAGVGILSFVFGFGCYLWQFEIIVALINTTLNCQPPTP